MRQWLLLSVGLIVNCPDAIRRQVRRGLGARKRAADLCCYDGERLAERATTVGGVGPANVLAESSALDHHVLQVGEPLDTELKFDRQAHGLEVITEWVPLLPT